MKKATDDFSGRVALAALPFAVLLLCMAAVLRSNPAFDPDAAMAESRAGILDLSSRGNGVTRVRGEWLFAWREFRTSGGASDFPRVVSELPGSWKGSGAAERYGFATYGLLVTGLEPGKKYALGFGQTLSACRVFVNGVESASAGVPSESREGERPRWDYTLAEFSAAADGTADIALQVSNHHDRSGGSNSPFYVGDARLMERMRDAQKLSDGFVFAILAILGLFFLSLYALRRKDVLFLWFAGICLVVAFRTLCYEGFVLLDLAPALPWSAFFRAGYATFPAALVLFFGFLRSAFPTLLSRRARAACAGPFLAYALVVFAAPIPLVSFLLVPMQLVALPVVAFGTGVIARAASLRLQGATWILAGFSFAVAAFAYDVLVSLWIISGMSLVHVGMSLCLFCLAMMVIERYSSSFATIVALSSQLEVINRSLRRFVPSEFLSCLRKASITEVRPGDCVELEMAIVSADIRSFTSIAERMTPDEVFGFLNEYLEVVAPIIRSNGGFIAKYEGDGFIALFPSGADAALRGAVQLQSAITARNRTNPGRRPLMVGVGIDAGTLALGTVGDGNRMDGTVISSCVRCAGRFESATKQFLSRILVNDSVFSALADPLAWFLRPVDRVEIGRRVTFLFEVYNNDNEYLRDLKWRTQSDLEHAVYAWFAGHHDEARVFLARVLALFPDDPVASHYHRRLS